MKRLLMFFVALSCCFNMNAQLVDVIVEVHNATPPPAVPPGHVVYRVYARLQDTNDFMSAIYGIGAAPSDPDHALVIGDNYEVAGTHTIFNNTTFGSIDGGSLNTGFCMFVPDICSDSFLTIGRASSADPGGAINVLTAPAGGFVPSFGTAVGGPGPVNNGSWYALNGDVNGLPTGADNRVLLMQVTCPANALQYQINIQIFDGGNGVTGSMYYCHLADQQTVGIINGITEISGECIGLQYPEPALCSVIPGCMNPLACNYNPAATSDDGSCTFPGCNDPAACNYNAMAGCSDGSCTFPGCTDPTACNYNAMAGCDNGSCILPDGCTDPTACNFDNTALCDDGSCCFDNCVTLSITPGSFSSENSWEFYDPTGTILIASGGTPVTNLNLGCLADDCAYIFVMNDTFGDSWNGAIYTFTVNGVAGPTGTKECSGGCFTETDLIGIGAVCGCTDPTACNYDPMATIDDGSCVPLSANDECAAAAALTLGTTYNDDNTCATASAQTPSPNCWFGGDPVDNDLWYSFVAPMAGNIRVETLLGTNDDTSIAVYDACGGATVACDDDSGLGLMSLLTIACGSYTPGATYYVQVDGWGATAGTYGLLVSVVAIPGCTDPMACAYDPCASVDDGSCSAPGCTTVGACNYDPCATVDNGSCTFPGCTTVGACNYNAAAGCDDGSCTFPGCNNPLACNYDMTAGCDDGSCCLDNCLTIDMTDSFGDGWNGSVYNIYDATNTVVATGTLVDGINPIGFAQTDELCLADGCYTFEVTSGFFDEEIGWTLNGAFGGPIVSDPIPNGAPAGPIAFTVGGPDGCTDAGACNYDATAVCDDGSCTFPGCTVPGACNYNPLAGCDDGSCTYPGCTNPMACNYDMTAGCDDGSCTLPGCTDPTACNYNAMAGCNDGSCTYPGCTTPGACNYNPLAGCDDMSCTYPGCTNPMACNYVMTAGCDDGSCTFPGCTDPTACNYNPFAGCDDGSCVAPPCGGAPNDFPGGSIGLTVNPLGTCTAVSGDLTQATASAESAVPGADLWYDFVAMTPGARIEVASSSDNISIELIDDMGNPVDVEDVVATNSGEMLNIGNLTTGDTYYIAVNSNGAAIGFGMFTICVQWIQDSECDYGPGPYNLCQTFKADWVGAAGYAFEFTSQTTMATYSYERAAAQQPNTFVVLNAVTGLTWNDSYDVNCLAFYNLSTASGMEKVYIQSDNVCSISVVPQPTMQLRAADRCANGPRLMGATVWGEPWVCGSVDFEWEFTRTDVVELPIYKLRGAPNRTIQLLTVPGLVAGGTYDVRVRPIFVGGPGNWGPVQCMSIAGPSGMVVEGPANSEDQEVVRLDVETTSNASAVYPNPTNGEMINVNVVGLESDIVRVDVFDMFGKLVYTAQYSVESTLNTVIAFDRTLASGTYTARFTSGNQVMNERFVVER